MNRNGAPADFLPPTVVGVLSEGRRDRQRRMREGDEHLHGAAGVVEADPAEIGQTVVLVVSNGDYGREENGGRWTGDAGLTVGLVQYAEPVMVKSLPGLARQALRSGGGIASPRFPCQRQLNSDPFTATES